MTSSRDLTIFVLRRSEVVHVSEGGMPLEIRKATYVQLKQQHQADAIWVGVKHPSTGAFFDWREISFLYDTKHNVRKVFGIVRKPEDVPDVIRMKLLLGT